MPTDDERRRVVERLREMSEWSGEVDCAEWGERVLNLLFRAGDDCTDGEYYARLVDLIEPAPKCSEAAPKCDRDALLALADEIEDRAAPDMGLNGDTTPAWYAAARMKNVARRIREACGEVVGR